LNSLCYSKQMIARKVRLTSKALKLLTEYSDSQGLTPSQALVKLVPKPKKATAKDILKRARNISEKQADKWLESPQTKAMSDREAGKFARDAVRRYRSK
jgi:hypothetical protein